MKCSALVLTSLLFPLLLHSQPKKKAFDIAGFSEKLVVAEWLFNYDVIAWWTSDSVLTQSKAEQERLGKEWFCFEDQQGRWHAVYGNYANRKFDLVFHFIVDTNSVVKRTKEPVDTALLHSYSRALITAFADFDLLEDSSGVRFNQFIKQNGDMTFTVWILPAFQPDRSAVYGGEFIYTIDPSGNNIIKNDTYFQGNFRGFDTEIPREIWLNYRDISRPTLGAIFFVLYYKEYFTKIFIETRESTSTLISDGNGGYHWLHVETDK